MSDRETRNDQTTLTAARQQARVELRKTVDSGQVRQSFSHGRSKPVQVEKKKTRVFQPGASGRMTEVKPQLSPLHALEAETAPAGAARALTEEERAARARALEDARRAEAELRVRTEAEAHRLAAEEEVERLEELAESERRTAEEEAERLRAEAEAARERAEAEARLAPEAPEQAPEQALEAAAAAATVAPVEEAARPAERPKVEARRRPEEETVAAGGETEAEREVARARRKGERRLSIGRREQPRRRTGKLTVAQALSEEERQRSLASMRRAREREKRLAAAPAAEPRKVVRDVILPEGITVQELANRMAVRGAEVVKTLMKLGVLATINQVIDADTAELVVGEFGHKVKRVSAADVLVGLKGPEDRADVLRPRPPVVTVMGHVDHGKTSLLDALRATDVAAGEAGGITQHIGAYQVKMPSGAQITFLDTPGHEAFTQMRARGAKATDIVVLVVAADDGVMPQTVEAIRHAQAAHVPLIVAINKIDRPAAQPERVRQELLQHGVVVEEMGGEVLTVPISATRKINLDRLEEAILLQAEILDLKANPHRHAAGLVIEAKRERGRGVVVTVLVQRGTLHVGDILVAGMTWGRVRALVDDKGRAVREAPPSLPVEVLGLSDTPIAGDEVVVVEDEERAREVTAYRQDQLREQQAVAAPRGSVEQMLSQIALGEVQELPVVIKADVHGSLEAIQGSVEKLGTAEVAARMLLGGVGGITESDIALAAASKALVIGFNVRADAPARALARRHGVEIRYYAIIYELIEELRALLSGMLKPTVRETTLGYARVKQVFSISKLGKVAGCEVTEGVVRRGARARLLRDHVVVYDGALASLKRHKDDVREVKEGLECGLGFEHYQDLKEGDVIEAYEVQEIARALEA